MTLVVGYAVDPVDQAPLRLAGSLARTGGDDVVLATVTPRGFDDPRTDRECRRFLAAAVRAAQQAAVPVLDGVPQVRTVALEAPSVPAGLVTAVRQVEGSLLVLGAARGSATGRFGTGSVAGHLLHSSPVPLALAPRDCLAPRRVERLSCAYAGTDRSREALAWATRTAQAWRVPLRLLAFAPERPPMLPAETGLRAEALVSTQWAEQARAQLAEVVAGWPGPGPAPETHVAAGAGWAGALAAGEWLPGEVLVVGSSRHGPLARVFLGSTATKIVRASPVPVVVVPRGAGGSDDTPDRG
ncbi:universal stress protein [Geodermatophilus sp. URMC 61]|uniref:universal stress protein n=1 Tax=Geodermatophilus sp. URMC 61 TaxID=3423411 RepID=UPI00406C9482